MTTILRINNDEKESNSIDSSPQIKLPLHIQYDFSTSPCESFDHLSKCDATVIESDGSTTCTNPRLKKLLETHFPSVSDDSNWETTDGEYDGSPDSPFEKSRRRKRSISRCYAKAKSDIVNLSDDDESIVASWPLYPIQCCAESRGSFNIPSSSSTSTDQSPRQFQEVREQKSIREMRCRQAIEIITAGLNGRNQLMDCNHTTTADDDEKSWIEKNINIVGELECSTFDGDDNGFDSQEEDSSSCYSQADIDLMERAKKIQHGLNLQELEELAWEAERAAEAGDEKFFGSATKFGIEEATAASSQLLSVQKEAGHIINEEIIDTFRTPIKRNNSRRQKIGSSKVNDSGGRIVTPKFSSSRTTDLRDQPVGASLISPPPRLKRFPVTADKKPKHISLSSRNLSAPSKLQNKPGPDTTAGHLSNKLTLTAALLSPRQFATVIIPPKKVRVMSLRHVDEVIPSFIDMHNMLRLNLIRNGAGVDLMPLDGIIDKTNNLLEDKEEDISLAQVSLAQASSFSFLPRVDSLRELFSSDFSVGTREGDTIDYLDNSMSHEAFNMAADQIIDDTIDCMSCEGASQKKLSQQVLATPKRKLHIEFANDDESDEISVTRSVTSLYACTLASEVHIAGRENVWTVSPLPSAPCDVDEHCEYDDCLSTPQRVHNDSPPPKSRWSYFWEKLSPRRKRYIPSPLRLPRISSGSLIPTTLSAFKGTDFNLEPPHLKLESLHSELESSQPELEQPSLQYIDDQGQGVQKHDIKDSASHLKLESLQSELESSQPELEQPSLQYIDDQAQGIQKHDIKDSAFLVEVKENIAPSLLSFDELYHRIKVSDHNFTPATNTANNYERAKMSLIDTKSKLTLSSSSNYELAKQTFDKTYHNKAATNSDEPKLSYEGSNSMELDIKKYGPLSEQTFSSKINRSSGAKPRLDYFLSLLSNSDTSAIAASSDESEIGFTIEDRLVSDGTLNASSYLISENIVTNNSVINIILQQGEDEEEGNDSSSVDVQVFGPKPVTNGVNDRCVYPLQQVSVSRLHKNLPEVKFISQQAVENLNDKPPLYPDLAVTKLATILKRVNQRLSAKKENFENSPPSNVINSYDIPFSKTILLLDQQAMSEPSLHHQNESIAVDNTSEDSSSKINVSKDVEALYSMCSQSKEDTIENIRLGFSKSSIESNANGHNIDAKLSHHSTCIAGERELPEQKVDIIKIQLSNLTDGASLVTEQPKENCHKKQSSISSLPNIICFGDESSLCGIGDGGTEGICDVTAEYLLAPPCDDKSAYTGLIGNVPSSIVGQLSPLLGRSTEDVNIPDDLPYLNNYFYIGVDPKDVTSTKLHNNDNEKRVLLHDEYCGSYQCIGLDWNINAALECVPDNNFTMLDKILDRDNVIFPEISSQGLRLANTPKNWSDDPLFQRGKVKLGNRVFDSPSLQLKKGGVLNEQEIQGLDNSNFSDMDYSCLFEELESHSQDTFAADNVEVVHSDTLRHGDHGVSRCSFSPIKENLKDTYHASSNEIEVFVSKENGIEENSTPSPPKIL